MKPSRPPFIPQERHNTCCLACLRMALAHQDLAVPSEDDLLTLANMQSEGTNFTELRRLARAFGLRADFEFPRDVSAIPEHIAQGRTVIVQIDRFPLDGEVARHAVVILSLSDDSVTFLDAMKPTWQPPGERTIPRMLFEEVHELTLVCEVP